MSAKETINVILDYLGMTPSEFSKCIGLDRPQAIFDMQSEKTKSISKRMANKIKKAYPAFSEDWLIYGKGEMLEYEMPAKCFTNKSPQVISKTNMDDAFRIIQDLIKQLAKKDDIIAGLTDDNKQLAEDYKKLSDAFEKLASMQGVEGVEPKKVM